MEPKSFDDACALVRKRDPNLSRTDALKRARRLWPDLLDAHQTQGVEQSQDALSRADLPTRNAPEVVGFEKLAREIQARDGVSYSEAYRKAARELPPSDFAKFRGAIGG